jgi:rhomboid family GlyGly-CTERM serine protease
VTPGARAWLAVAALLGAVALGGALWPHAALDWQPAIAAREPWRALTAVGVHYDSAHLAGNLAGAALAALFGVVARVTPPVAWAWLVAWPLTQLALLSRPDLAHYGGLSGVLHAGVSAVATFLLVTGTRAQRVLAAAVFIGLSIKLWSEAPWGDASQVQAGRSFALAPLAHLSGTVAGLACTAFALGVARWSSARRRPRRFHRNRHG